MWLRVHPVLRSSASVFLWCSGPAWSCVTLSCPTDLIGGVLSNQKPMRRLLHQRPPCVIEWTCCMLRFPSRYCQIKRLRGAEPHNAPCQITYMTFHESADVLQLKRPTDRSCAINNLWGSSAAPCPHACSSQPFLAFLCAKTRWAFAKQPLKQPTDEVLLRKKVWPRSPDPPHAEGSIPQCGRADMLAD